MAPKQNNSQEPKPEIGGGGGRGRGLQSRRPFQGKRDQRRVQHNQRRLPRPQVDNLGYLSPRARELAEQLIDSKYECANCLDVIRLDAPTWSCHCCFNIFHLNCITRWSKESCASDPGKLLCPHCRTEQPIERQYRCFCGKFTSPSYSPLLIPHSCGNVCGGSRGVNCPHKCTSLCHPGPCTPCNAMAGPKPCPCGASTYTYQCGQADPHTTCGAPCGKLLKCGLHRCEHPCHTGDCGECAVKADVSCGCGRTTEEVPCGTLRFCGNVCDRQLDCKEHTCPLFCHIGPCPPCATDITVVTTCPCGSSTLSGPKRLRCTDPIPTCGHICGKALHAPLADGQVHTCSVLCHTGPCPPCSVMVTESCACGYTKRKLPCCELGSIKCTRPCGTKLSCGRHYCREVCCAGRGRPDAPEHECFAICERQLKCGHTCNELCHAGSCPPCINFTTSPLYCRCRAEMLMPPQPCGALPPSCSKPCQLPRPCGHKQTPHPCHYGDCPICTHLVTRTCAGGHTQLRNIPCWNELPCCSSKCLKPLPCGHICDRQCHGGDCVGPAPSQACKQPCTAVIDECGHVCGRPCHMGTTCPPCMQRVDATCKCGRSTTKVLCGKYHEYQRKHGVPMEVACKTSCDSRFGVLADRVVTTSTSDTFYYSKYLWDIAANAPQLVRDTEQVLDAFLTSKSDFLCLPPANSERRHLVHALCVYYNIHSHSVDEEPHRSCTLTRTPNSRLPPILLSESVKSRKNDPHIYYTSVILSNASTRARLSIQLIGEHVNEIQVTNLLRNVAGSFVFGGLDRVREKMNAVLVFHSAEAQGQGLKIFRQNTVPFEYCVEAEK